jgi:hypothetical protein
MGTPTLSTLDHKLAVMLFWLGYTMGTTLFTFCCGLSPVLFRFHNGCAYVIHFRAGSCLYMLFRLHTRCANIIHILSWTRAYTVQVTQWARLRYSHLISAGSPLRHSHRGLAPRLFRKRHSDYTMGGKKLQIWLLGKCLTNPIFCCDVNC